MRRSLTILLVCLLLSSITACSNKIMDKWIDQEKLDNIYDNLPGVKKLTDIADNIENLTDDLSKYKDVLEAALEDEDAFFMKGAIAGLNVYKKWGYPNIPEDYQNWTKEKVENWVTQEEQNIEQWKNSLSEEQRKKFADEETAALKKAYFEIFDAGEKAANIAKKMQVQLNDFPEAMRQYLTDYNKTIEGIKNGSMDLSSDFYKNEVIPKLDKFAKAYADGNTIEAFKYLDEVTGLFSESEAMKGLDILLESSEAIGLSRYMARYFTALLRFSGEEIPITEDQMTEAWEKYIREFKNQAGIGSSSQYAEKLKDYFDTQIDKVEQGEKTAYKLKDFMDSPVGQIASDIAKGKGRDAIKDVISNTSGIDKATLENSGIMDIIDKAMQGGFDAMMGEKDTGQVVNEVLNSISSLIGIESNK